MSSIIVSVSELSSIVKDVRRSGSDFVRLSVEVDEDENTTYLDLAACKNSDVNTWIDFDPIDAVEQSDDLENQFLQGLHMSSNML